MKKLITISITLLLLTGCGNKIICKTNKDTISETYTIKYSDNTVTKVTTEKTYRFDSKDEFKNFEPMMQYIIKSNTDDNIKSSYKKKNKKYILKQEYKVENISEEDLIKYGLNKNKEELVNNLKNNGLTCK